MTTTSQAQQTLVAARLAGTTEDRAEIAQAYRAMEHDVTQVADSLSDTDELVTELVRLAARRLPEDPIHARSLILLGILAERSDQDLGPAVAGLLEAVKPGIPEPLALALAYLFAHFPSQSPAIEAAFDQVLAEEDRQRVLRCLEQPEFTTRQPMNRLGRVWPSPATWTFTDAEQEQDRKWRATLDLDPETIRTLWDAETTALLAFMGARAESAIERSSRA